MKLSQTIFLFLAILSLTLNAQNAKVISGVVYDSKGNTLEGVSVYTKDKTVGTQTDNAGYFEISIPSDGVDLVISYLGFKTQYISLDSIEDGPYVFHLIEETTSLDNVTIQAKTQAQIIREQAFAVDLIETESFKNLSTNANDILDKIPGVNIRESGGVGSSFNLSMNGLSGNQVRVFLDGVPMDYFGSSLTLNNFSANIIDQIEVYKGVVPIHLSSDALGGAINVITSNTTTNFLDASYSYGSFNTQLASLNAQYRNTKSGLTFRLKGFSNASDNNYKIPIRLVNFETGKEDDFDTYVERFHDAYYSNMLWAEVGFTQVKFADQFFVGAMYSDNYKEIQQPSNAIGEAKVPYGEVGTAEKKWIGNLSYKKRDFLIDDLTINSYFVAVFSENISKDISDYSYDWFGNKSLRTNPNSGEIEARKTLLTLDQTNFLGNFNAEYRFNESQNLAINYAMNLFELEGSDLYKKENSTQFSEPSKVSKNVLGTSFNQGFLDNRLQTNIFAKTYFYGIQTIETNYSGTEKTPFDASRTFQGFGLTASYKLGAFLLKSSYEKSVRFPEVIELFGNGLEYESNPSLEPEQSHNFNLGFQFTNPKTFVSFNAFYRNASDFIIPQVQGIKVFHINNGNVRSMGVDLGVSYQFWEHFRTNFSGTYVDMRDRNQWLNGQEGNPNSQFNIRIPNEPYLYGNLGLSYQNKGIALTLTERYVHSFYYRWENLASNDKGIVPDQWVTDFELTFSAKRGRYNLGFLASNLLDAEVYDNYQQLKPGRAFSLKLRYFIN